jgi:hypothetical protein
MIFLISLLRLMVESYGYGIVERLSRILKIDALAN